MSSPLGEARIRIEADGDDFANDLDATVDAALDDVIAAAVRAFNEVEGRANAAGNDIGDAVRAGSAAAQRALDQLNSDQLGDVRARALQAGAAMEEARRQQATAAQRAAAAEQELRDTLSRQDATVEDLTRATNDYEAAQRQLREAAERAARTTEEQRRAQDQLNDSQDEGSQSTSGLGDSMLGAAGKVGGLAAALGGVVGVMDTVMEAIDRNSLGNKLQAQLDLSPEETASAARMAGDLYAQNFGESFEQVNDAIGAVHSSLSNLTDNPAEVEGLTKAALTLASAFDVDVNEAVQSANNLVRTGLASSGEEALDMLGAAFQRVPASMRDEILPILDEYGTYMSTFGLSGQEAVGMIVNASQGGAIAMDKVGDALKEFGIRATDMSKTSVAAYDALGLNAQDMTNQLLAGGDTARDAFNKITDGLAGMSDPSEQAAAALALFGTPLEDLNVTEIPGFLQGLSNADSAMAEFQGTTDEMADSLSQGPGAALETMKRQIQDTFLTALGNAASFIIEHGALLRDLAIGIGGVTAALTLLVIQQKAAAAGGFLTWMKTIITSTQTWAVVQGILNAVMSANPIMLIVLAIGALVGAIVLAWKHSETFRNIVMAAWQGIQDAAKWAWENVLQPVFQAFMDVLGWIGDKAMWLWTVVLQPVFSWIGSFIGGVIDVIVVGFRLWQAAMEVLGTALRMLWDNFIFPILAWIGERFVWLWSSVIQPVLGWISGAWQAFYDNVIAPVAGWIGDRLSDIGGFFTGLWNKVLEVVGWITGKLGELRDWFGGLVSTILSALGNPARALWDWGVNLIQGLLDGAGSLLGKIGDFFLDKVPGWIKDPFKKALGIASPSKVFAEYGKNIGEGMVEGVASMEGTVQAATQGLADAAANVQVAAPVVPAALPSMGTGPALPAPSMGADPMAGIAMPAVDALGEGLLATKDGMVDPALAGMEENLTGLANTFPAVNDGTIQPALASMAAGLIGTKDGLVDPALWGIQGNMVATGNTMSAVVNGTVLPQWNYMGNGIMAVKTGSIDPAFAGIQGGLQTVQGAFATGVQAIGQQWDQMRGAVGRPVRFAIDTVFNNGLVGMWNSVSDLIGTNRMNPYLVGGFASGGVLPGYSPGRDNFRFVTPDGRLALELGGGEGIARPEVVRALGTHTWDGLNAAAAMGGEQGVQEYMQTQLVGKFAGGGIVDSIVDKVRRFFPGMSITSTFRNSADLHGAGKAVDFSDGFDTTPGMQAAARFFYQNYGAMLAELIHWPLKGWQNVDEGRPFDFGAATNAQHRNHVHVAAHRPLPEPGTVTDSLGAAASFSMVDYLKEQTKPLQDAAAQAVAGYQQAGLIGTLPQKTFDSMFGAANAQIEKLAKEADVSAGAGGAVERWRPVVVAALKRIGNPLSDVDRTLEQIGIESGGDPAAINLWDSNAAAGDPSVGLLQIINSTFQSWRDRALPDDRTHPLANIVASARYARGTYGSLASIWPKRLGYDLGGEAIGKGLMFKDIITPERVLSTEQTKAFNKLVDGLTASGSGDITVGGLTLSAGGRLNINGGRITASGYLEGGPDARRTVMVTQYITGDNPKQIADETSAKLLSLLP